MDNRHEEYEDDVFSLEDDLEHEKRKQFIQYILVSACAVLVVAFALYGSILLTDRQLAQNAARVTAPTVVNTEPTDDAQTNYWPGQMFAEVPVFAAVEYQTKATDNHAEISVPTAAAADFDAYIDTLVDAGAKVRVRSEKLSVLDLNGTEVHIVSSGVRHEIVLCKEADYAWTDTSYTAFPLPASGRLVAVAEGIGVGSRILTYRDATPIDALGYVSALTNDGWAMSGAMEPTDNMFLATLKKNNLQIRVDYFSSDDEYQVKFDYLT